MKHVPNVIEVFIVLHYEIKWYIMCHRFHTCTKGAWVPNSTKRARFHNSTMEPQCPLFLLIDFGWKVKYSDTKLVCTGIEDNRFIVLDLFDKILYTPSFTQILFLSLFLTLFDHTVILDLSILGIVLITVFN